MKLDNYELVISFAMPCYLYIEGESKEKFYVDEQACDYYLFNDKDAEPNNIKHVDKNNIHLCKWLVNESYHDFISDDSNDDTDYEYYDWDFKNHCVKKD